MLCLTVEATWNLLLGGEKSMFNFHSALVLWASRSEPLQLMLQTKSVCVFKAQLDFYFTQVFNILNVQTLYAFKILPVSTLKCMICNLDQLQDLQLIVLFNEHLWHGCGY